MATKKNNEKNVKNEKLAALQAVMEQIEKQHGAGSIMRLGDNAHLNIDAISTGSITLDVATGIGGFPKGRIVEIYGPESSGKTTLALHAIAEAQKAGGLAAFIDAEHALDPEYSKNLGVDIDSLVVSQPDNGEEALEIAESLVRSVAIDILVIDSVAALVPKSEIEDSMGDSHMGLHARLMSQALRKLTGAINKSNCLVIFINQLREKIGNSYGNPEVTTGGRALKFYSSMRVEVRKSTPITVGSEIVGNKTNVKIVKNKVAPPFRNTSFDIIYGKGIDRLGEIIDLAIDYKILDKKGSWISYNGENVAQGREKTKDVLIAKPELKAEIESKVTAAINKIKEEAEVKDVTPASPNLTPEPSQTRAAARARLDIAIDDDDDL